MKLVRFLILAACFVSISNQARADDFLATKIAVIHEEANSTSKEKGRLEQGESAPITTTNSDGTYFKIKTSNGIEGWVSKTRGKVVYSLYSLMPSSSSAPTTYNFYFGNLHSHVSELSTETNMTSSTYAQAFDYAMKEGGLDFLAITIHNHLAMTNAYSTLLSIAKDSKYYKPGKFVPIAGQEFSTMSSGNHVNVLDADAWIKPTDVPNGEFKMLYETWLPYHKTKLTSMQFNHPASASFSGYLGKEYGLDDYDGKMQKLLQATDKFASTIEIIKTNSHDDSTNKPHMDEDSKRVNAFLFALNEGWHLAPTANEDNHRNNWGTGTESRTACLAPELTKEAILGAIKNRNCYATEDENLKITFMAGKYPMGSIVDIHEVSGLSIKVEDSGEPKASYSVKLYMDKVGDEKLTMSSKPIKTYSLKSGEEATYPIDAPEAGTYYFLRVTQSKTLDDPNGTADDAWTAPIWVEESAD